MRETDDPQDHTLDAYERGAARYAACTPSSRSPLVDDLLALIPNGAVVLELGSGPGRDALALEAAGVTVHRTDGASAFVERLRSDGHEARVLDVRADDFGGPHDAVFANAVLLHVPRHRLRGVLETARRATHPAGILAASFKKGDGDEWSTRKLDEPRRFTYWREDALSSVLLEAGWMPLRVIDTTGPSSAEAWITVIARNPAS